jgi:pheromone shutdown protein TraB
MIKDKIILLIGLSFSFCIASFILEVVVKDYDLVARNTESWLWFFSGFCASTAYTCLGLIIRTIPAGAIESWLARELPITALFGEPKGFFPTKPQELLESWWGYLEYS